MPIPGFDTIRSVAANVRELFTRDARQYTYLPIDSSHVKGSDEKAAPIRLNADYFRVVLAEMHLTKERQWFKNWYPMVYSLVRLTFGNQQVDFPYVAGTMNIANLSEREAEVVQQSVRLNYPLTALLPFKGGSVELEAGLVAIQGDDLVNRWIKALGNFAEIAMIPPLSAGLKIGEGVAKGLDGLLGVQGKMPRLYFHNLYEAGKEGSEESLQDRYYALIGAEKGTFDAAELWVEDRQLVHKPPSPTARRLSDFPYMLIRVKREPTRDDWHTFSEIDDALRKMTEAFFNRDYETAEKNKERAMAIVANSPDFTRGDRTRIWNEIKLEYEETKGSIGGMAAGRKVREPSTSLAEVVNRAPPLEEAEKLESPASALDD